MTIMPRIQAMPFLQAALILFVLDIILEGRGHDSHLKKRETRH
jgi:hypothetical protein